MSDSTQLREFKAGEFQCIVGVKGELGFGAYGVVRLSFHRVLGVVALKCFLITGGERQKELIVREIQNEMDLLCKANHSHILRVYGWTQWSGSMAMVLEYMPGGNLYTLLRDRQNKMKIILRLRMCYEVADAISFLHNLTASARLIHGDIKPENVLLSDDLHCKLADFGGAKFSGHTGITSTLTKFDMEEQVYTSVYAAPERLGDTPVRPRKDQDTYSFGLIIHMALTGEAPYEIFPSVNAYVQAVVRGGRPDVELIDELKRSLETPLEKEIVGVLEQVMKRCWDQTPTNRPNMLDVRDQLQEVLRRASGEDITQNALDEIGRLKIGFPLQSEHDCAPLQLFDLQSKSFKLDGQNTHQVTQPTAAEASDEKVQISLYDVFYPKDPSSLPPRVQEAAGLLKTFKEHLLGGRTDDADATKATIVSIVQDRVETTAYRVGVFAQWLLQERYHEESIVLFDAAALLHSRMRQPEGDLRKMRWCVRGMRKASKGMIGQSVVMKDVVRDYVIPLMREKLSQMAEMSLVTEQWRCLQTAWVMHHIEISEHLVDQQKEREETLKLAISRMRQTLGEEVFKHRIFAHLLNNLGVIYGNASLLDEAADQFQEAIKVKKEAVDYESEEKRKQDMVVSEKNMKKFEKRLRKLSSSDC